MKRFFIGVACLMSFAGFGASANGQQSSLSAGEWSGGFEINQNYTVMRIRFSQEGATIKGTLAMTIPPWGRTGALNDVKLRSSDLHFEWVNDQATTIFDGQVSGSGDVITGSVQSGNQRGTFKLAHTIVIDEKILAQYVGDYQIGRDSYVSISRPPAGEPTAALTYSARDRSSPDHRNGQLFPVSQTAFVAGPGRWVPYPVEIKATFVRNERGQVTLNTTVVIECWCGVFF